jgi:hypothetical protein
MIEMKNVKFPLALLCTATLFAGACGTQPQARRINGDSTLAALKIGKLETTAYKFDKIRVQLSPSQSNLSKYDQYINPAEIDKSIKIKILAGEYDLVLEYLKDGKVVLSNVLCEASKQTTHLKLRPMREVAVNSFTINVCDPGKNITVVPPAPADEDAEVVIEPKTPDTDKPTTPQNPQNPGDKPQNPAAGAFLAGTNVAWINFARDVGTGNPNLSEFGKQFDKIKASGGNVLRLWLHTNGALTPVFEGGKVTGPGEHTIDDLKAILKLAKEKKVSLILALWSFDMLREEYGDGITKRNRKLLTEPEYLDSYINNALMPMVRELKDSEALHSWEVCNEAEGMARDGENWSLVGDADRVTMKDIQYFTAKIAAAIHKVAPQSKVTTGITSFKYASNVTGKDYYADSELQKIAGDKLAKLDYYQVHYYSSKGQENNPFRYKADYWKIPSDKQIVIGEFYMQEYLEHGVASPRELYTRLRDYGYHGALGWKDDPTPALKVIAKAIRSLTRTEETLSGGADNCAHFSGGYDRPFFDGEGVLYRKKRPSDYSNNKDGWCVVD